MKINIVKIKKVIALLILIPFFIISFYNLLNQVIHDVPEISRWLVVIVVFGTIFGIYQSLIWTIETLTDVSNTETYKSEKNLFYDKNRIRETVCEVKEFTNEMKINE